VERGLIRELWAFRELVYFLAWRDIKVRYKQTVLGLLWAVIQPLFTMLIFTVFFARLAKISTDGMPGPIFYFSALVPWIYFSSTVSSAGMSLVTNSSLLTKIYFPRIILPAAAALGAVVDFLVSSVLLMGFMVYYHIAIGPYLLVWLFLLLVLVVLSLGLGTFCAALNVKYRDVKYALPFVIQLLMFATPIIYPASLVPDRYRWLLALNPLATVIESFRRVAASQAIDWRALGVAIAIAAALLVAGVAYFRSTEKAMADLV
jgi:lipopolysaccharide transport system permease protein